MSALVTAPPSGQPIGQPTGRPNGPSIDSQGLADTLRQMLAVLEQERQALAGLDIDALLLATSGKQGLCDVLEQPATQLGKSQIDAECRGLLEAARHQNEVNRRLRNLLAANVAARLDALTQSPGLYSGPAIRQA